MPRIRQHTRILSMPNLLSSRIPSERYRVKTDDIHAQIIMGGKILATFPSTDEAVRWINKNQDLIAGLGLATAATIGGIGGVVMTIELIGSTASATAVQTAAQLGTGMAAMGITAGAGKALLSKIKT